MIIEYDFGKKERSGAKRIVKSSEDEAQRDPQISARPPFLDRASLRAAHLEKALRDAHAAHSAFAANSTGSADKILVDKSEYARLLRCKEIIEAALAKL